MTISGDLLSIPSSLQFKRDQILIDVTDANVQIDDEVTVLGNSMDGKLSISVSDIAQWNKTIEWEILTNMSKRLERFEVE